MFGILVAAGAHWAPSAWKVWIDHILRHREDFAFRGASMVHAEGGAVAYASAPSMVLATQEVASLRQHFEPTCELDTLRLQGKTYIVKSRSEEQLVVFSGRKYFIISKSLSMYIIVLCESRSKCDSGAAWLKRINHHLIEKAY